MYISITKQHLDKTYSQSSSDFVDYLEKENEGKEPEVREHFFDQKNDRIGPEQVIKEIDGNTAKLKKVEPKFYSLTINPSQRELKTINNDPELLRRYVREIMKDYAASFHRDRPVTIDDIKYFAKIEHGRNYKGFDKEIKENQVYRAQIAKLENDLRKIERGELQGSIRRTEKRLAKLNAQIPHKINGKTIEQGMEKPGFQTHVHIIVSRKDVTDRYSLSPGSKYMRSESELNGRTVKRGFDRDRFYERAEKTFDTMFKHKRNFVETYEARKTYLKDPHKYFARLLGLPTSERGAAFKILGKAGVKVPLPNIPTNKVQLALTAIKKFKKAMDVARTSSSIGI